MLATLFIIFPILFFGRLLFIPSYCSLIILILAAVIPSELFRVFFFITLVISYLNYHHLKVFNSPLSFSSLKNIVEGNKTKNILQLSLKNLLSVPLFIAYSWLMPIHDIPFHPFFLLAVGLFPLFCLSILSNRRVGNSNMISKIENENKQYHSKKYPLEKFTKGFYGEKLFSINGEKPHIITLFIDNNSENDGNTVFDLLSKQGILFSNFYSNACMNTPFHSLFHILYGIPAYFGSDEITIGKNIQSLKLSGLPNLFKKKGYLPLFIKNKEDVCKSLSFFLSNHGYEKTISYEGLKVYNNKKHPNVEKHAYHLQYLLDMIISSPNPIFAHAVTQGKMHLNNLDASIFKFIAELNKLNKPVHLYLFENKLSLELTKKRLLVLPINCGEVSPSIINDICSEIDICSTMMDLYDLKGKNSSIGSSLVRKRENPHARIFNDSISPPVFCEINRFSQNTEKNSEYFNEIQKLFLTRRISSRKHGRLHYLDFSNQKISNDTLREELYKNRHLKTLKINNCILIDSLKLPFAKSLEAIEINNNLFIKDKDIKHLPRKLESISLNGCLNLTDKALSYLSKLPLKRISLTSKNFSQEALYRFASSLTKIEYIFFDQGTNIDSKFFSFIPNLSIKEINISGSTQVDDKLLLHLSSHPIRSIQLSHSYNLSNEGLKHLKKCKLEQLHIKYAHKITDEGINHLSELPFKNFSISEAKNITESSLANLNNSFLESIECIDCGFRGDLGINLSDIVDKSFSKSKNPNILEEDN